MPFIKVNSDSIAASVAAQIRELIAADVLHPGDRLPSERELCERMGVSRTSLREAIKTLVTEKLLVARRGSGLSVSEHIGADISTPLQNLIEASPSAMKDFIGFRRMLEGECAAAAAKVATDSERAAIMGLLVRLEEAAEADDEAIEASLDTEFHMAITNAAHNVVVIQVTRSMHSLLRKGINVSRERLYKSADARQALLDQHRAIASAIHQNNPEAAREAMHEHLDYVSETMARNWEWESFNSLADRRIQWASEVR